jgi:hypothetical protein
MADLFVEKDFYNTVSGKEKISGTKIMGKNGFVCSAKNDLAATDC